MPFCAACIFKNNQWRLLSNRIYFFAGAGAGAIDVQVGDRESHRGPFEASSPGPRGCCHIQHQEPSPILDRAVIGAQATG